MLTYILIAIGSFIALIIIIALILPKKMELKSEIIIAKPSDEVFNYVVHLKNQKYFSKWVMADPDAKHTYSGEDGTVGFIAAWDSKNKNVGKGEQEITAINPGKRYDVELRFEKPFKATNHAYTEVVDLGNNQTKVITCFQAESKIPQNIVSQMMKGMLLKDLNQNAENLKRVLEG